MTNIFVQLSDIEDVNPHQNPPVLLVRFLCLEELRKPDERTDSVLDSLYLPPVPQQSFADMVVKQILYFSTRLTSQAGPTCLIFLIHLMRATSQTA